MEDNSGESEENLLICLHIKRLDRGGWCFTWFLSSSDPTNHVVDPGHLIVGVDVHAHFPVVDKIGINKNV